MRIVDYPKPTVLPVLLEEFKDHLRIDTADEDASLGALLATATELLETKLDLAIIRRTATLFMDRWEIADCATPEWWQGVVQGSIQTLNVSGSFARLPVRPVENISEISVLNAKGEWQVWPAENYLLKKGLEAGVNRKQGRVWPTPQVAKDGIKISLNYGFGNTWNDVPAALRQAVLMLSSYLYSNKGTAQMEDMFTVSGVMPLIAPYMRKRL